METRIGRRKLNRIKAVLAESGHIGKWLSEQLGKDPVTVSKGCAPPLNWICIFFNSGIKVDIHDLLV